MSSGVNVALYVFVPAVNTVAGAFQENPVGNVTSANTFPLTLVNPVGTVNLGVAWVIDQLITTSVVVPSFHS